MDENNDKKVEHKKFLELCEYVKTEILELPDDCKFPKHLALRLKGLRNGKFMANNKVNPMAEYSFEVILLTFKINKYEMLKYLRKKNYFKDEEHRINYMMSIVEIKINDTFLRVKQKEKDKIKIENKDFYEHDIAEYKPKTKEIKNSRLNDLW